MRFSGAIFDVDGVLVDSPHERAWRESLRNLMAGPWRDIAAQTRYKPERFTTEIYQRYVAGKPREAGARAVLEYFGVPDPDGQRLRAYCDTKQAQLIALIEHGEFEAFPDALHFLLEMKQAGLKLAAASSSKNANMFLRKVPLAPFSPQYGFLGPRSTLLEMFDRNVCGLDVPHGKPAPDLFCAAAAELDMPTQRCVVVEDAGSGVQAAKAGGMACVGIARLEDSDLLLAAGADWVVTNLDDLPVARLLA